MNLEGCMTAAWLCTAAFVLTLFLGTHFRRQERRQLAEWLRNHGLPVIGAMVSPDPPPATPPPATKLHQLAPVQFVPAVVIGLGAREDGLDGLETADGRADAGLDRPAAGGDRRAARPRATRVRSPRRRARGPLVPCS